MNKKLILTMVFIIMLIALTTTTVQANYQSVYNAYNYNKYKVEVANRWITNIRNMEADGQVMGLTETKDDTTLMSTSGSNNIDVHMTKNTEWGAMVILSASTEYGKQGEGEDRYVYDGTGLKTTTGNVYGVYPVLYNSEWVAGGGSSFLSTNIDSRYIDRYSLGDSLPGDAFLNWHDCCYNSYTAYEGYGYLRGRQSVFSFTYSTTDANYYCRACVVSGTGF